MAEQIKAGEEPKVETHTYKYNVNMMCGGCTGAVERILGKFDGVKSYDVELVKDEALKPEIASVSVVADPNTASFTSVWDKLNIAKGSQWGVDGFGKRHDRPKKQ